MNTSHDPGSSTLLEAEPFNVAIHLSDNVDQLLFTAEDARPVEDALLERLETLPVGSLIRIDFTGVRVASEAARQLLRRALKRVGTGEMEDRFLVLSGLGSGRYNVEVMLRGEALTVAERLYDGTEARLLGQVDPAVRDTYAFVIGQPEVRAKDVFEHFQLTSISTATNRLSNLARLGLAYRTKTEAVAGGGRQHVYIGVK